LSAPDLERLHDLANAYGVHPTLESVADAIINRTAVTGAVNERKPVFEVVGFIVRDEGTLSALASGNAIPSDLHDEMVTAVATHGPAMPPNVLVDLVLADVRVVLSVN
jgi:hypothetical protein